MGGEIVQQPGRLATVPEALAHWAIRTPDAVAVLSPGHAPLTYRELQAVVERLATVLRGHGLGRGDGIALLFAESPELFAALLAAMSVGKAAPLAWPHPEAEYREILRNPRLRAIVTSTDIASSVPALTNRALPVILVSLDRVERDPLPCRKSGMPERLQSEEPDVPGLDDVALILHSSGATGRAKLVPRTHGSIASLCQIIIATRDITPADRCLSLARAWYSQGINALAVAIFSGGSVIVVPGTNPRAIPVWLENYRPTFLSTTPAVLRMIAAASPDLTEAIRHSSLRSIHSTAGPLLPGEMHRLEQELGIPVLNGYGMSEAPGIAGELYPRSHHAPGAVGRPWCELRIVDAHGACTAQGESGEIVVRGERVFPGYLDDLDATAAVFLPGGWFRTGDLGYLDDEGFLHLTGRQSEVINRGGENIVPDEIDRLLLGHPSVAEAAVFAAPHALLGEDIVAAVVLKPGAAATTRALRRWLLDRGSPSRTPRRIWFLTALPRTRTGKVQRGELARRWHEEQR